jgi:hypothetical protein
MTLGLQPELFNSPLEAGMRAIVVLDAFFPHAFDLKNLSILDFYIVHTSDIEADLQGPESLHPPVDARKGEFFVRRRLVEEGLALMERAFLLERVADGNGLTFRAREVAAAMVDLMESPYNLQLREASRWIAHCAESEGHEVFFARLESGVGRWSHEVAGEIPS